MKSIVPIKNETAIVFSASLDVRNCLRNNFRKIGVNAVCFKDESICLDNFESIQPEVVIAETDSVEAVWRFVFALHVVNAEIPLIVASDHLKTGLFSNNGLPVYIKTITKNHLEPQLFAKLIETLEYKKNNGNIKENKQFPLFLGNTESIVKIRSMLPSIANAVDPVLIIGERGTGKELLANLIVGLAKGKSSIIKVDCDKIEPDMISDAAHTDVFGLANEGRQAVVFLDCLEQLTLASQAEMLLLIEASEKIRYKSNGTRSEGIRFIASVDPKIEWLVQKDQFRKDLFYRLNVIPISIPALRERKADIPILMDYFTIRTSIEYGNCIKVPSQNAREICFMHDWPGNVAELRGLMQRIVEEGNEAHVLENTSMSKMHKNKKHLLNSLAVEELPKPNEIKDYLPKTKNMSLKGICNEFVARTERRLMKRALESTSWNRKKAAKLLNISYKSMLNKMKTYDIA